MHRSAGNPQAFAGYVHPQLTGRSYTFTAKRYPFPVHEDAKGEIGYEYVNGNESEESTVNMDNEVNPVNQVNYIYYGSAQLRPPKPLYPTGCVIFGTEGRS